MHTVKITNEQFDKINLILENSASMGPYYKSADFQTNLTKLISNLPKISTKQAFLISDTKANLSSFASSTDEAIDKIKFGFQIGGNSPLDDLLINLIERSKADSSINILVTDLIIDDPSLDFKNELNTLKARIQNKFNEAKKSNLAAIIYRFEAKYSGKYFTSKNGVAYDIDQDRPYFFWVIVGLKLDEHTWDIHQHARVGAPFFHRSKSQVHNQYLLKYLIHQFLHMSAGIIKVF